MRKIVIAVAVVALLSGSLAAGEAPQTTYRKGHAALAAAHKLVAEKKTAEALAAYLQLVQDHPKHQSVESALSRAAGLAKQLKKYEQSVEIYERMLKELPNGSHVPSTLYALGSLYCVNLRDYTKAAQYYARAATEFPGNTNAEAAYRQEMQCYSRAKDYAAMSALADKFMASMPQKGSYGPQMLSHKALAHIGLGDLDAAAKATEQLAALTPQDRQTADAYYRLGSQFSRKKEPKRASECYLKAAGISSYERAGHCLLTAADVLRASNPEESVKLYRRYQEEYSKGALVHDSYARIALVYQQYLKDTEKEIALYEEFVQKHENSIILDTTLFNLARAAVRAKKPLRAISAYEMLLDKCPNSTLVPQALYGLGIAYRAQDDKAKARELFERVVKDYPAYSAADSSASALKSLK